MELLEKIWVLLVNPYVLSLLALAISSYTLWDNKFRFKLVIAAGRQIKLHVAQVNKKFKPCIFLNLALLNVGGKSGYLSDIKLSVCVKSNGKICFDEEFEAIREFDTILKDALDIKQSEVLPIVLAGKTAVNKGYVFVPLKPIAQDQFPKSFDIEIKLFSKQKNRWTIEREYKSSNISDVWQDLENEGPWNYTIQDIEEKA